MEWINFDKYKPCENQEIYYKFPGMGELVLLKGIFHIVGEGYLIMSEVGIIPISRMKPSYWKPILISLNAASEKTMKVDAVL